MSSSAKHIAVVGSGIAGLSCAYYLSQHYAVTLYEAGDYIGGHTHTVMVTDQNGCAIPIDTGFIVFNYQNYPLFTQLLRVLKVADAPSNMSFSYFHKQDAFYYASVFPQGIFAQRENWTRLGFYRLLWDIARFFRNTRRLYHQRIDPSLTLGAFVKQHGYSKTFLYRHLYPTAAAIWSVQIREIESFPLETFIRFFYNHGLLNLIKRPQWRTVSGGAISYIRKILDTPHIKTHLNTPVLAVESTPRHAAVSTAHGVDYYDAAILATHADQAFTLLAAPTPLQKDLLSCWRYSQNHTILHRDPQFMPPRKSAWSSWNFYVGTSDQQEMCVTYYMNMLQPLGTPTPYFVTLNPPRTIAPHLIEKEMEYTHPIFDAQSIATQAQLSELNTNGPLFFCGSYFGNGFHEDAVRSAVNVVERVKSLL